MGGWSLLVTTLLVKGYSAASELLQQSQEIFRHLVGLRKHRHTGLRQDLQWR